MGDNRDESMDSRFWGFVDLKDVEGKAFIIYWSWNREEHNLRWQRLGNCCTDINVCLRKMPIQPSPQKDNSE